MNHDTDAKMVTVIVVNNDGSRELKRVKESELQEAKRSQSQRLSQTSSAALSKAIFG